MSGPNVLDLVGDIREAVERLPRDQLVDILTYVFKEYVVEGPAPLPAPVTGTEDSLAGMSFAEVVRSLQLRLDLPELELFDVQGERVTIRLQGRQVPVEVGGVVAPAPSPVAPAPVAPAPVAPAVPSSDRPAAAPVRPAQATAARTPAAAPPAPGPAQSTPAATQQPAAPAAPQAPAASSSNAAGAPAASQQAPAAPPRKGGLLEID